MKNIFKIMALLFGLSFSFINAQEPLSYFPHSVGNRWDYNYWSGNTQFYTTTITRDSLSQDGSKFLFYDNENLPRYKLDTSSNVFLDPYFVGDDYLIYKLSADSGEVWFNNPEWAWVARIDTGYVFSNLTTIKVYQYGPAHPDSTPFPYILRERWLASGFGLIYEWEEPWYFYSLKGCIVEGDTFGIITTVEFTENEIPNYFAIKQNYPNPFNSTTNIRYTIPQSGRVTLTVYDLMGSEVTAILDRYQEAGTYDVIFQPKDLASGVYFYTLSSGDYMATKKLILLK